MTNQQNSCHDEGDSIDMYSIQIIDNSARHDLRDIGSF